MAWRTGDGGRRFRKDASAAKRSETERAALVEPTTGHRRKSMPNYKKKFGVEQKYIGPDNGLARWLWHSKEWRNVGWYEKARDRDQAIESHRRGGLGGYFKNYEYRPIDR